MTPARLYFSPRFPLVLGSLFGLSLASLSLCVCACMSFRLLYAAAVYGALSLSFPPSLSFSLFLSLFISSVSTFPSLRPVRAQSYIAPFYSSKANYVSPISNDSYITHTIVNNNLLHR